MILILTECGGAPFGPGTDFPVYVNSDALVSWTAASAPKGATALDLVGHDYPLFVRQTPLQIYDLLAAGRELELEPEAEQHARLEHAAAEEQRRVERNQRGVQTATELEART